MGDQHDRAVLVGDAGGGGQRLALQRGVARAGPAARHLAGQVGLGTRAHGLGRVGALVVECGAQRGQRLVVGQRLAVARGDVTGLGRQALGPGDRQAGRHLGEEQGLARPAGRPAAGVHC